MPELVEVERYRCLAEQLIGLWITAVGPLDPYVGRGQPGARALGHALVGREVTAARRRGKLLLLDTGARERDAQGPTLGLRFGMTGTLLVGGRGAADRLLYAPSEVGDTPGGGDGRWVRFRMAFEGTGGLRTDLALRDPRRLSRVLLDPPEDLLGPDAASVTVAALRRALSVRRRQGNGGPPLKARLMDQQRLAGIGNLMADEILWRAGLDPARPAGTLSDTEVRRLHRRILTTTALLLERGGSHTGDLVPERRAGGRCPKDGTELAVALVGGRRTWWCPGHQR